LGLCPTIIQSHWDADHYSTALFIWQKEKGHKNARKVPDEASHKNIYDKCSWLVRRQRNGPSSTDFVRGVQKMVCWPENLPAHSFEIGQDMFLRVERCIERNAANSDRNLCGLAVRLISTVGEPDFDAGSKPNASTFDISKQPASSVASDAKSPLPMARDDEMEDDEGSADEDLSEPDHSATTLDPGDDVTYRVTEQVILPGDAPFQCLPSHKGTWHSTNVNTLFAYHHGSHTHLEADQIPKVKGNGITVYTYGLKKGGVRCSYGHPHMDAVEAYEGDRWEKKSICRFAPAGPTQFFETSNKKREDCFVAFKSVLSSPKSDSSGSGTGSEQKAHAEQDKESARASTSKPVGPFTRGRRVVIEQTAAQSASKNEK
jgi:hypothetical protein